MSVDEERPAPGGPRLRDTGRSILVAGAIVAVGVLAGLMVGGAFETVAPPTPGPTPVAVAPPIETPHGSPISIRPATPRPSPTPVPTPAPSIVHPTPGPDGVMPPLPPIEFAGADPAVIAEIGAAIQRLADLDAYRFSTFVGGRAITDLSAGGIDLGLQGSLAMRPEWAVDAIFGFRMVEFECSAATSSSSRYVIVGNDAWEEEDGVLQPTEGEQTAQLLDMLTPAGVADRTLAPFAGGFERVGSDAREGVPATRYRATAAGLDAYATVTGIEDGSWTAEAWVADAGHLLALSIAGEEPDDCGGFFVELIVRDANDPAIVIVRPS